MENKVRLHRGLNSFHVQLISLGGIIGSCYFLGIGDSIFTLGPATLVSLALGGLIVWLVANGIGELCVGLPREGSFVAHSRELVGHPWAAGVGWSYWINWCAYVPSEMIAGGLVMHQLVPAISAITWAIVIGLVITIVNLFSVKNFGVVESGLALIKILALLIFCVVAALILLGLIGSDPHFIGLENVASSGDWSSLFPVSVFVVVQRMVMSLVNFQGTEIIALSAAETEDPEKNIPRSIRNVSFRIIAAYIIPVTFVMLLMPYQEATVDKSVFVASLERHGLLWGGVFFAIVIVSAALSCANSGIYGASRSLYFLAKEGLAPQGLAQLNHRGVPVRATLMTVLVCWIFVPFFALYEGTVFYKWLLAVSGFTGAICWVSISWCQLRFRRAIMARGYKSKDLGYAVPGFPVISYAAIWIQVACLGLVAFDPELRSCLYLGVPSLVIPMLVVYFLNRRNPAAISSQTLLKQSLDHLFPDKSVRTESKPLKQIQVAKG